MNEERKHLWASDKEKRGPMSSALWRRILPYGIAGFCMKKAAHSFLIGKKGPSSPLLYSVRRKEWRETDVEVMAVVTL